MRKHLLNGTVALSLALSACSFAPTYERPQMALPAGWSSVAGVGVAQQNPPTPFWQELGSAELNRLIDNTLAQNLDLEAALHRIEQARAQAKSAAAPLYPTINASGSASRTFQDPRDTNSARGVGSISYEVDLWGKNRNAAKSADYRINVTEFDREALRLVVTSDATNFYSQILSLNDRIRIAELNLKSAEEILRITEARFSQGSVSGLEVSQQRVFVNNFRTAVASLIEQRSTTANALAILLGLAPQNFSAPTAELATLSIPPVNLTPPATLLTARPDIESAEAGSAFRQCRYRRSARRLLPVVDVGFGHRHLRRLRRPGRSGNLDRVEFARADLYRRQAHRQSGKCHRAPERARGAVPSDRAVCISRSRRRPRRA